MSKQLLQKDEDDALKIANNSVFELSGVVFTKDKKRGECLLQTCSMLVLVS